MLVFFITAQAQIKISKDTSYIDYFRSLTNCDKIMRLANGDSLSKIRTLGIFDETIYSISKNTGFVPYYQEEYHGYPYPTFSMSKSLYKINLLQWAIFYNCSILDSSIISSGNFCPKELIKLENLKLLGIVVDTTLVGYNIGITSPNGFVEAQLSNCRSFEPKAINVSPCELIRRLSNPKILKKMDRSEFYSSINFLSDTTGLEPYMGISALGGRDYLSLDLTKSLYRINLVQWANYFKCNPQLPPLGKRRFTVREMELVENQKKYLNYIDTTSQSPMY